MSRLFLALLVPLSLTVAGCHRSRPASAGPAVLRYPVATEIKTFDPAICNDLTNAELLQNVFESLVTIDADSRIAPLLAERWDVSPDGRTYTFQLRGGVRFHNGRAFTAADVKWSWERALWPETHSQNAANYLSGIIGVKDVRSGKRRDLPGVRALDERTVAVTLDRPQSYFLGKLTMPATWIVCRDTTETAGNRIADHNATGTGAFKLQEYRPNARVVLVANGDYWGGRPAIDRVDRPIVLDMSTMHMKFESDEADIAAIAVSDYARDAKTPGLRDQAHAYPLAEVRYIALHFKLQPAFRDRKVRQAIAASIDRGAIEKVALQGALTAAYTILPPGIPGADPADRTQGYDPVRARSLLAEAGYPGGAGFPTITLAYIENDRLDTAIASIVRDNLRQNLGIQMNLQGMEFVTFNADTTESEKIPCFLYGWVADYLDAQDFLSTLFRTGVPLNHYGYSNAEFDALCDRADEERDTARRTDMYRQAERIALRDVAVIPIYNNKLLRLVKPRVEGFRANLINILPLKQVRIRRI